MAVPRTSHHSVNKDPTVLPNLTSNEARIIGCLMEKSVVTPELYLLTLNAPSQGEQGDGEKPPIASKIGIKSFTSTSLRRKF
jgi:hypothetical protein